MWAATHSFAAKSTVWKLERKPRNLTNIPQPGDPGGKSAVISHVGSMDPQYDEAGMLMGSTVSLKIPVLKS